MRLLGASQFYRVRLPHNKYSGRGVIVGEGKPENQNHATIFAFGEGLQVGARAFASSTRCTDAGGAVSGVRMASG